MYVAYTFYLQCYLTGKKVANNNNIEEEVDINFMIKHDGQYVLLLLLFLLFLVVIMNIIIIIIIVILVVMLLQ